MLEDKLRIAEAKIAELTKENNLLKKVQDHQGKALVSLSNEEDYPLKINAILEDLRTQKEHNKVLKQKLYDADRSSRISHENMVQLEHTVRELKSIADASNSKNQNRKEAQRMNEAADKIDELIQANQFLVEAKDKAVKLTG